MRLRARLLSALALVPGLAAAAASPPPVVQLRDGVAPATTEAIVELEAPPDDVYRAVTDFRRWAALLSDVSEVEVIRGGSRDAEVRFESRSMGHSVTLQFDNQPGRALRFRLVDGAPGAEASGEYRLLPLPDGRTRIVARLAMDVTGPIGWLVPDSSLQEMRADKLRRDLGDLARHFASRGASRGASSGAAPASPAGDR